jgi:thioredoxin-dependent peroxiredoxin
MFIQGEKAPDFNLPSHEGANTSLKSLKGKKVVLFFYPKDMTPGCTTEACDSSRLKKAGAIVLGISRDSIDRHKKFVEKEGLNFPLLSDEEGKVCKDYGVWQEKSLYGKKFMGIVRSTFVIDNKGKIFKVFEKVKVTGHIEEVIKTLKEMDT